jgi:hypothetical protein
MLKDVFGEFLKIVFISNNKLKIILAKLNLMILDFTGALQTPSVITLNIMEKTLLIM